MGGCVVSVLQSKNDKSLIPHERIRKYRSDGPTNVKVADATDAFSATYRLKGEASLSPEELHSKYYNGNLVMRLKECCSKFGDKHAIGYRPIDKIEKTTTKENGKDKKWEFTVYKPTVYMTFTELWAKVLDFGRGLRAIGCTKADRIGIYDDTRAEWLIGCYGMWSQGMTGVTVYSSLGEAALEYALREAEVTYVITNGKLAKNLVTICKKAGITTPTIIHTDAPAEGTETESATLYSFEDICAKGNAECDNDDFSVVTASPDDIALIMYTSGTTGDPKGVVMSHGNVHGAVTIVSPRLDLFFEGLKEDRRYVAYLPLAHILEFTAENAMLLTGSFVGYGNPRTLTDAAAKPQGDLKEYRPHLICGVPRVFDTIKKAAEAKIPPGVKKRVFTTAYDERVGHLENGMDTPYYNTAVFGPIRELLGGSVVAILSGGAPMSAKTQEFVTVVSGASVVQGYGLTETCAITTTQVPGDLGREEIGAIMGGTEIKLRDVEDWKHTDEPNPRGEILVRGSFITKGYYKQEAKTKEAFTEDGWFCTGDVGSISEKDGVVRIVGRVKALAKNTFGEYISMEALEAVYVLNELALPNGVCVLVDGHKSYIAALVLTDEGKARKFATANGISGEYPAFLESPEFQKKAGESFAATAKQYGKKPFECVKQVRILADEWTPENGALTAAFKLKRSVIDVRYSETIAELFKGE